MTDPEDPEDHPRADEAWEAAKEMGEAAAAEARQVWEANERFRLEHGPAVAARAVGWMLREERNDRDIDAMVQHILSQPNAWWGEVREGRQPPLNM